MFVLVAPAATAQEAGCKLAVTQLDAQGLRTGELHLAEIVADSLATELADATACSVITHQDVKAMLDYEAERAACGADSSSCLAEIGDALGVDMVISGAVRAIGDLYTVNLQLIDIEQARVIDRAEAAVHGEPERLRIESRNLARKLFKLEPIPTATSADLEPIETGPSLTRKLLLYAGFSTAGVGAFALTLGVVMASGSYFITQNASLDGNLKAAAGNSMLLFGSVAALGLLAIPIGLAVGGAGFVLE